MSWSLENYSPVNDRILRFKELFPEGSLAPLDPARPFWIELPRLTERRTIQDRELVWHGSLYRE